MSEWLLFKNGVEEAPVSWIALLFAILAIALRGSCQIWPVDLTLDKLSVEYELRAWDCLIQVHIGINHSNHGLKALILIAYQRANRGLSIGSLTRMAVRIARDLYPPNDSTRQSEEKTNIWNSLVTLCSLTYQLSKSPSEEWVPVAIREKRTDSTDMKTFATIHTKLDAKFSEITQVVYFEVPHDAHQLEKELKELQVSLEAQKNDNQPLSGSNKVHFLIIENRLHYLFYHLFSIKPFDRDKLRKERCLDAAKQVLRTFNKLVLTDNQLVWWYLSGVGSLPVVKCALTLATYSTRVEWPLSQTEQIFYLMANQSRFCIDYMPRIQEAILFGA